LYSDSIFCLERGCEASSNFFFGRWRQKKNMIYFTPVNRMTYQVINKIESEHTGDKKITVILYDMHGENITNRVSVAQHLANGAGSYCMDLDSSQTRCTDFRRANSSIILRSLERLFNQKIEFATDSANLYKVYLNISGNWNFNIRTEWGDSPAFQLRKADDTLISLRPNQIDDKGNLKPAVYIRQN
jgi:hypothetical protein